MQFIDAIQIRKKEIISLVGAGGKTSIIFALAQEATQRGLHVLVATTTKIYCPDDSQFHVAVSDNPGKLFEYINNGFTKNRIVVAGKAIEAQTGLPSFAKLLGLERGLFSVLPATSADLILVEADGSAGKPFKAPAAHEPVIPYCSTIVMPVVGIDCIGNPLSADYAHRPELIAQIAKCNMGERITSEVVAAVLTSGCGYRKELPPGAQWVPCINKVSTPEELALAREVACQIIQKIQCKVLIGSALDEDPVRKVVAD